MDHKKSKLKISIDRQCLLSSNLAAFGAVIFGVIQDKMGALKTFNLTLVIWIISIIAIFGVKPITAVVNSMGIAISVQWMFVIITSIAGMGLGQQSSSRAIVAVFAPESKIGEFFRTLGNLRKSGSGYWTILSSHPTKLFKF